MKPLTIKNFNFDNNFYFGIKTGNRYIDYESERISYKILEFTGLESRPLQKKNKTIWKFLEDNYYFYSLHLGRRDEKINICSGNEV